MLIKISNEAIVFITILAFTGLEVASPSSKKYEFHQD